MSSEYFLLKNHLQRIDNLLDEIRMMSKGEEDFHHDPYANDMVLLEHLLKQKRDAMRDEQKV